MEKKVKRSTAKSTPKITASPPAATADGLALQFERAKENYLDIQKRLDDVYMSTGWTSSALDDYFNNPNNFAPAEWKVIQMQMEQMQTRFTGKTTAEKQNQDKAKSEEKKAAERKGKTLGSRKKWIPMR